MAHDKRFNSGIVRPASYERAGEKILITASIVAQREGLCAEPAASHRLVGPRLLRI